MNIELHEFFQKRNEITYIDEEFTRLTYRQTRNCEGDGGSPLST